MFRNLKKRVKNLGQSVHGRSNSKHGSSADRSDDSDKLNTPARQYPNSQSVPTSQFTSSPSSNTVSTSSSDYSSSGSTTRNAQMQQYHQGGGRPPPSTPTTTSKRRPKKGNVNILDVPLEELDVVSKIEHLSKFDVCVEASDALAASSGLKPDNRYTKSNECSPYAAKVDEATGLRCTAILVSPEGEMLPVPPSLDSSKLPTSSTSEEKQAKTESLVGGPEPLAAGVAGSRTTEQEGEDAKGSYPVDNHLVLSDEEDVATIEDESNSGHLGNSPSESRTTCRDDFESSVYVGHDLHPLGDKSLNGFSAKGWSIPATSLALEQTELFLSALAHFCEQMILSRKESAARTAFACDNLREAVASMQQQKTPTQASSDSWVIIDPRAGDFEMTQKRTGPLVAPGSTLAAAVTSFEDYYLAESEKEAHRWRAASLERDKVLPKMHDAVDSLHERSMKRQLALQESSRRVQVLEERIRALQQLSEAKWQEVYDAEERVTIRHEELMEERRFVREKARLEKLKQDESIRLQETAAVNRGDATLGATSKEIWDMVASVVDPNADSFEPMDLPSAPLSAPRDKSIEGMSPDEFSSNFTHSADATSNKAYNSLNALAETTVPILSREDVAIELGLPQLRTAAMQADEAVRETADSLLNVLSAVDTTRRSARIAAETFLLCAANAQSACLQTWIKLERESLEERLRGLNSLDEKIKNTFNVRADLDAYITADKKERGGSSHLGDDDDGGIASALAVLSSHVDGMERDSADSHSDRGGLCDNDDDDDHDDGITTSQIEEALEYLFHANTDQNNTDTASFEKSVLFLCTVGAEKSRGIRSSLCYALNSKRGANARMLSKTHFDALARVFNAILTGCNAEVEVGGVSNAKMCMMLAQTFYMDRLNIGTEGEAKSLDTTSQSAQGRNSRLYVKNALLDHPIWSKDAYWDVALSQQISESLTHSGVMSNFERSNLQLRRRCEYAQQRKTRWYDLSQTERVEAASQVHAVVFAQLGALAHSMLEFGCGLERACAFVRRMSIRNQLPSSHRTMLLMHLMERDGIENAGSTNNNSYRA